MHDDISGQRLLGLLMILLLCVEEEFPSKQSTAVLQRLAFTNGVQSEDFVAAQVQLKDKYLRLEAAQEAVSGTLLQLEDNGEEFETDFIDAESYRENI
ncbi:hypothetical protein TNCV_5044021 [Trichonephila clavipes]|uniref:Uncharacterized protein n=1 Tax=Trichonephila clavipes TaxID=2585209 RepID=A0A8X7BK92_TRICX|nr:hypothetical protein TNCV_5044021 [Trichonephila clavipes]